MIEKLNKKQNKKAMLLIELLCKNKTLNNIQVNSIFENSEEKVFICTELENAKLIKPVWADGDRIATITCTEKTYNYFETNSKNKLKKMFDIIKRFHKATIWVVGGLIMFLTLTVLLFQNYDYLKKLLNPKESSLQQESKAADDNNALKIDSLNENK